jgi:hypothetical protein
MRSIRKLKTCLASLALISFATCALAMPGKYSQIEKGQPSPFSGYCFDITASAYIIADKEIRDRWCTDQINKSLSIQEAEFDLKLGKLLAEYNYEKSVNEKTIESLREENMRLESTALTSPNNYWYMFMGSGILMGVVTTILVVQASK